MIKKLAKMGNSMGVILDKPILELLKIDEETPLELAIEGDVLTIRPVRAARRSRVRASAEKLMKAHDTTLKKLAR